MIDMKRKLKAVEDEDNKIRLKKTTDLGFMAIKKENNLEQMIIDEENLKGTEILDDLKKKIQAEKKKCIQPQVEERDIFEEKGEDHRIKALFQKKIAQKRYHMKTLLENIRRKQKLKRQVLEQELKETKAKISRDLLRANYVGDIKKCIRGKKDVDYRDSYCNQFWVESFIVNGDCHKDDTWCEMCCQHEFGDNYIRKRYKCFDICDEQPRGPKAKVAPGPGKWTWVAKYNTGGDLLNPTRTPGTK